MLAYHIVLMEISFCVEGPGFDIFGPEWNALEGGRRKNINLKLLRRQFHHDLDKIYK